ncbi:MAG: TetR family transcriptional regulator [Acidimicrobiales bacterium]
MGSNDTAGRGGGQTGEEVPPPGRRERKRRSTRAAIVEAAFDLFEAHGYNQTSIDDITERADVARRTFFRHFPGKDAVLLPDFDDYLATVTHRLAQAPEPLTLPTVFDAFVEAAPVIDAKAAVMIRSSAIIAANQVDVGRSAWRRLSSSRLEVAGMIAAVGGLPPDDDRVLAAATLLLHLVESAVTRWITATPDQPIGAVLRRSVEVTGGLLDGTLTLS